MAAIPEPFRDLLTERETYATLATLSPDGLPHLSMVWVDYDPEADRVLVNTERDRRKARNARADPRAAILAPDPDTPYRWLSIAGEVTEVTTEGAREHIDALARRYTDEDAYTNPIESERVLLRIRPDRVVTY